MRIRNDGFQDIYLPSSCGTLIYDIFAIDGPKDVGWVFDPSCLQTCADLQTEPPISCGACQSSTYRLPAGGSLEVIWKGTGLRMVEMEAACWFDSAAGSCAQEIAAPPGQYRFSAIGYAECSGECTCDANGQCVGDPTGAQALSDFTKVDLPGVNEVEIVFGGCAFGCP